MWYFWRIDEYKKKKAVEAYLLNCCSNLRLINNIIILTFRIQRNIFTHLISFHEIYAIGLIILLLFQSKNISSRISRLFRLFRSFQYFLTKCSTIIALLYTKQIIFEKKYFKKVVKASAIQKSSFFPSKRMGRVSH